MKNSVGNDCRMIFIKTILILLGFLLLLEIVQRYRYFLRTDDVAWLFYGFKQPKQVISVKKRDSLFKEPFVIVRQNEGKNILFIGGSSTYGVFNDDLHTYPYLLQKKVKGISCLNAGMPSLQSDGYYDIVRQCFEKYCIPYMIVFYTGYNDLFLKSYGGKGNIPLIDWLGNYSLVLATVRGKFTMYQQITMRKNTEYRMRFVKEFEKNLERCISFAKEENIKVVLIPEVLMAEKFDSSPLRDYRWYAEIYGEIPLVLKNLALKYECVYLDPKNVLRNNWEANFLDPVHLTDKGNDIISTFLAENIPW